MKTEKSHPRSRREFLKMAASVTGVVVVAGGSTAVILNRKDKNLITLFWRLNPAFRVNEISTNTIELVTQLGNGELLKHQFTDAEADLFRVIANEQKLDEMLPSIAKKNRISLEDCRETLNKSLHELAEAKLIYTGEKMLVKVVEATNG